MARLIFTKGCRNPRDITTITKNRVVGNLAGRPRKRHRRIRRNALLGGERVEFNSMVADVRIEKGFGQRRRVSWKRQRAGSVGKHVRVQFQSQFGLQYFRILCGELARRRRQHGKRFPLVHKRADKSSRRRRRRLLRRGKIISEKPFRAFRFLQKFLFPVTSACSAFFPL